MSTRPFRDRDSSVLNTSAAGRPPYRHLGMSRPPSHPANHQAPDFNEDVTLLAQHPENYRGLLTKTQLQNGLADAGIQQLDGVQGVFLRHCLKRRDIFGMLPAKSGKTAIFVLATLQMLCMEPRGASYRSPSVLVLAPTRELAEQIYQTYVLYGKNMSGLHVRLFIGGMGKAREDLQKMMSCQQRVHIVVATPGRLRELIQEKYLHVQHVKHFIFDEADHIFGQEDMRRDAHICFTSTLQDKQTMLFGSTFSGRTKDICLRYLRQPFIWSGPSTRAVRGNVTSSHRFCQVHEQHKLSYLDALLRLVLSREPQRQILIFVDTRARCAMLVHYLEGQQFDVVPMQGGLLQNVRFYCIGLAKENKKNIVVTTDLCARGLEIPHVSLVISFDCPTGYAGAGEGDPLKARDIYYHRANRCGSDVDESMVFTLARDGSDVRFLRQEVLRGLGIEVYPYTPYTGTDEGLPKVLR